MFRLVCRDTAFTDGADDRLLSVIEFPVCPSGHVRSMTQRGNRRMESGKGRNPEPGNRLEAEVDVISSK